MKRPGIIQFLPGIAWFFVVLVLICLPGNDIPKENWLEAIHFDKWVHAGIFGLMAFLFMYPFRNNERTQQLWYFFFIAVAISMWGLTTEFIQKYWITGRSFDLLDWAADSLGALIAFLFCRSKFSSQ